MAQEGSTRSSIRVARIGGIDIRMHWSFLVLVILVVWVNISSGASTVGVGLLWITAVFASVLVHEYAHCIVARRRGAVVEDILLLPIGGLSQLKKMPERPADELAIAIVGPLTSLGLATLAVAGGLVFGAHLWPPYPVCRLLVRPAGLAQRLAGRVQPVARPPDGRRTGRCAPCSSDATTGSPPPVRPQGSPGFWLS